MSDEQQADVLDLRDYLRILRRRRGVVILTVVLVVAAAMAVTLAQTPIYESSVRLVPERFNESQSTDSALQQLVFGQSELETQREVVTSNPVAQRVINQLGLDVPVPELLENVDVQVIGDSQVLEIRAQSTDPQMAAALAQGFADGFLEFRRDEALERTLSTVQQLQQRARQLRETLEAIAADKRDASGPEREALEQEENALLPQLGSVQAQLANLSATQALVSGGGQIIRPAEVPESPASPRPLRTGILAVVLGLMLGVGMAFLRDFMDDSIRNDDEARRASGRPVLGQIPLWKSAGAEGVQGLAAFVAPKTVTGEAYQTLHTNLRFMAVSRDLKSLLVTSAGSGDGKTTTAANLAIAAARTGRSVLLVGVDFRRPKLHRLFEFAPSPGLTELLAGDVTDVNDVVHQFSIRNLRVIPSGSVPPNPAELLNSAAMSRVMAMFEERADLVIYDGPPVLAVADALELSNKVGGSLIVVNAGRSGRHAVRASAERLRSVGAEIVGVVLNNLPRTKDSPYYYYSEYYGDDPEATHEPAPLTRRDRRRQRRAAARRARPTPAPAAVEEDGAADLPEPVRGGRTGKRTAARSRR